MDTDTLNQDGRHARLEKNKAEVIRALLLLIRENGEIPTIEVIAKKAGVSRRSMFRFFDSRESLLRATVEYMYREVKEHFPVPDLTGSSLIDRVRILVDHLASVYEYITPVRRVSEPLKTKNPLIRREQQRVQQLYRQQLQAQFIDILPQEGSERDIMIDTVQLIASWNAWMFLRNDRGYSLGRAKTVMTYALLTAFEHTPGIHNR